MNTLNLPVYCPCCGAYLMGGATKHTPECYISELIDEVLGPDPVTPEGAD